MSLLETVLPRSASNDYRGGRIPFVTFCLLTAVVAFRSFVHFFKDDSGVNSIASIHLFHGDPDPNQVIYMYSSLWGSQQLIMLLIYLVVLYRYRNLIPLMFTLMIVEVGLRVSVGILHPLTAEYFERTPPGKTGNLPLALVCGVMVYLSYRHAHIGQEPTLESSRSPS